jgi:hypothetical protein
MEGTLVLGLLVLGVGAWIILGFSRSGQEADARSAREDARAEECRVRECGEVVRFFANHVGYVARDRVSREELSSWIDSGVSADELANRIWKACGEAAGVLLGHQPLGAGNLPVVVPESLRPRHVYVVGKSGSGKTTLLRNLILQDLHAGRGLAVLAPEAELLDEELLPLIPERRWKDVVYVDPADTARPVPLNPLHLEQGEDLDLKVDETFTIFQRVFSEDGTGAAPRMEAILRQGLSLLMRIPGATLLDFERLLDRQDDSFRRWAVVQVNDPEAERFWLQTYPAHPKDAHLPLVNRLGRFLGPRVVRSLLCAPGCLNVRAAMDEGRVLLFSLSDGLLGATNAELLGQLVVAKIQMAAMSRADQPKESRRPFSVYLDEFQTFCGVAGTSYEKILSRARKYGLSLVLAHQQTGQIPEHLMREILGNVATVVCFVVGASDAKRLGREMVGEVDGEPRLLDRQELLSLRVGEAWCRIDRNVLFLRALPPPKGGAAWVRDQIIQESRLHYGVEPKRIDLPPEASRARLSAAPPPVPVDEVAVAQVGPELVPALEAIPDKPKVRRLAPPQFRVVVPTAGRGGGQHRYLQELLRRWAEARDWRATIEEAILDGLGSVDVALRKGDQAVACEISVTTTPDHEVGNIQKCLAAGFDHVIFVSPEKKTLNKVRQHASAVLPEATLEHVHFGTPDEAFAVLEGIEAETAGATGTVRGYSVKVKYRSVGDPESKAKRQAVSGVIARTLRRLKGAD